MNDDDLAALMRGAASTEVVPPAAFDHSDVVAASHRITRRRRTVMGAAAGIVLVAGIGGAVVIPNLHSQETATSAAAAAPARATPDANTETGADASQAVPLDGPDVAQAGPDAVPDAGTVEGNAIVGGRAPITLPPPLGPGTSTCENRQDPALRRLLDAVFPAASGATEAATTDICAAGGGRAVNLEVAEGSTSGLLVVTYVPPGASVASGDPSSVTATEPTASGGVVTVAVSGDGSGGRAPYADQVAGIAKKIAPRL